MNLFSSKKSLLERSKEAVASFDSIVSDLEIINEEFDKSISANKEEIEKLTTENLNSVNQQNQNNKIIQNIKNILK